MIKLNKAYFIFFIILITILQYLLYEKTIKMDKLTKGLYYISTISKNSTASFEIDGYKKSFLKLRKESNGLFNDVYHLRRERDSQFKFLYNYKLIDSNSVKGLDRLNLKHKNIYDSCDSPGKMITNDDKTYLIAQVVDNDCYSYQTTKIYLSNPNIGALWYFIIALSLIVITLFIVIPEDKRNRNTLSIIVVLSEILFFVLTVLSIKDRGFKFSETMLPNIKKVSTITFGNVSTMGIIIMVITVLFLYFFNGIKNKRLTDTLIKHKTPYLYILPGTLGITILLLAPLFSGIILSFFKVRYNDYSFVWFANYSDILIGGLSDITNPEGFYYTFLITVVWTAVNIFFHLSIGMSIALVLNRKGLRFKKVYSIIFIIPWAIPNYITALIWKSMFHKQFGAINNLLVFLGFDKISWFSETFPAFMANLLTNIWLGFPFMMVMTLGALQSIPNHLYDAAVMDGATRWQQFRHVTLPMLKPALLPSIILGIIWTFNMFNVIYLVSGGEPNSSTDILITEAYRWAFERNGRYGYSAAYATIIFMVLFLYNYTVNKISEKSKSNI